MIDNTCEKDMVAADLLYNEKSRICAVREGFCQSTKKNGRLSVKKKAVLCTVIALPVLCLILAVCYFNSVSFFEARICVYSWFQEPDFSDSSAKKGSILEFYEDGECKITSCSKSNVWYRENQKECDWEILKDKTLVLDGEHYEWRTDWHISLFEVRIGDREYKNYDFWNYRSPQ